MISWIQRSFQRHFRLVFLIMLVVMAVPLIWVFNASSGMGNSRGTAARHQRFFGHDLINQGTSNQIYGDASLSLQLRFGAEQLNGIGSSQIQRYSFERLASLALADQLRIPAPGQAEIAAYIKTLGAFAGPDGQFDASRYASFRDNLKISSRSGVSEGDILRVISDDLRIANARPFLAGPGYVLPGEVREQLERTDTRWEISVASANLDDFRPEIPVSEDALKHFFEENAFRYDVPPRIGLDYVEFPTTRFLAAVAIGEGDARAYYDANPARFPKPAAAGAKPAVAPAANPDADFAAVRGDVERALRTERAQRLAAKAAADFTLTIYDQKLKPHTPEFDAELRKNGVSLQSIAPIYQDSAPTNLGWTKQVLDQALQLSDQRTVSDPLPVAAGSVVLFWRETLPSYRPELTQVRDRVLADYRENERRKQFVQWGQTVSAQLAARVKAGDAFDAAAARVGNGQPKLVVKAFPAFVRRQPPKDIPVPVFNSLDSLNQGQVSDMMIEEKTGTFVYVKEKKLPDLSEANPQYTLTRQQLARMDAGASGGITLTDIVTRELKTSGLADAER